VSTTVFITGATGLVGGAVALELLEHTDWTIDCLVRAGSLFEATRRLQHTLMAAAQQYDREELAGAIHHRCRALPGDISSSLWLDHVSSADILLHSAASLKYRDRDADEIQRTNVDGTQFALRTAEQLGVDKFVYVSTAYVAGSRSGHIAETDDVTPVAELNNFYEVSKINAERIVRDSRIPTLIVRPSIIVGHSVTYGLTSFSGMYGMVDEVQKFRRKVSQKMGEYLNYNPIRLLADPTTPLNLLPIDVAARAITGLIAADAAPNTYHITNSTPPVLRDCIGAGFREVGLPEPVYVPSDDHLTELDRVLQTEFYDSYMKNGKLFSNANTLAVVGDQALDAPLTGETVARMVRWYVNSGHRKGGTPADSTAHRCYVNSNSNT
jgi:nucleoside-diphosphate-sugar epimerase